ncbi:hypothetical protein DPMN_012008 [Dreissena polymorpha]|uniref:Uncharacterized protein n=1 Tax=Dreissena polymorpha TaxID=45954 RepID=A0A9D4S0W5_DREPO|nr:hypothetical protein DPMN_012008 [Dreissena polymorpha]
MNTAKKKDLWNSNAAELNLMSGPMFNTWYESVMTVRLYEKLCNKDIADRLNFLMKDFVFSKDIPGRSWTSMIDGELHGGYTVDRPDRAGYDPCLSGIYVGLGPKMELL